MRLLYNTKPKEIKWNKKKEWKKEEKILTWTEKRKKEKRSNSYVCMSWMVRANEMAIENSGKKPNITSECIFTNISFYSLLKTRKYILFSPFLLSSLFVHLLLQVKAKQSFQNYYYLQHEFALLDNQLFISKHWKYSFMKWEKKKKEKHHGKNPWTMKYWVVISNSRFFIFFFICFTIDMKISNVYGPDSPSEPTI